MKQSQTDYFFCADLIQQAQQKIRICMQELPAMDHIGERLEEISNQLGQTYTAFRQLDEEMPYVDTTERGED